MVALRWCDVCCVHVRVCVCVYLGDELLGQFPGGRDGKHQRLTVTPHDAHSLIVLLALVDPAMRQTRAYRVSCLHHGSVLNRARTQHSRECYLCRSGRVKAPVLPVPVCDEHTT
jgi:hypothetical protein